MKGEYRDDKDHHPHHHPSTTTTMFSKFNHHHHPPPPPPQQHFSISGHHHFHRTNTTSEEEADSRSPTKKHATATNNDGASIEVTRRPRGRPPGSKNKPKPPIVITREPDPSMSPYVLELPGGTDIVDALVSYCRKRTMGLCVLTGSGTVANVSLRQPSTVPAGGGATVTFHGRFDILSISATILPSSSAVAPGFAISLAGPQGQIVGGAVAGGLMTAGTVYVIAASFNNPLYHRLPASDDQEDGDNNVGNSGGGSEQSPAASDHHLATAAPPDSMSMYSGHLPPSDVIWAPTPRQAHPHPHPPPY